MGQSMEHLLGMIADIASSVWQFALNLPGALQIVFTLVALIVAGVCRMVAMRLSHPAQGSEPYDLPYDSGPCLVLSDTILRQRTHRS